jgi:hypothetical protein
MKPHPFGPGRPRKWDKSSGPLPKAAGIYSWKKKPTLGDEIKKKVLLKVNKAASTSEGIAFAIRQKTAKELRKMDKPYYIGETSNLPARIRKHRQTGNLSQDQPIEFKPAKGQSTSRTRRKIERSLIKKFSPSGNKAQGGQGRIAKKGKRKP